MPVVAAALRAESITEIPVLGRFLAQDPANRPGTVVPAEVLEAAARRARIRALGARPSEPSRRDGLGEAELRRPSAQREEQRRLDQLELDHQRAPRAGSRSTRA